MANKTYTTMSLDALKFLCSVINKTVDLPTTVISDTSVATNTTYSSYKIGLDMDNMENEIKSYVDTIIAGLNKLTKEIINDKALVVKDNVLYLYKADDDVSNNYMQMMLINGVAVELGSTQADFSDIYNKSEVDAKFALKLDLDTLTASFNTHVADTTIHITQDEKDSYVKKTDIATSLDDTVTDEQVTSALSTKTELDKLSAGLGELSDSLVNKQDYKFVVESGSRYVEDVVTQEINNWLPNDNSSMLINLKKLSGEKYANFQLICNKTDSQNWDCIVNGPNILWKINYVNGARTIQELVTMDKIADSIIREGRSVLYDLNNVDNIEVAIDIAKSGYKPIAVSLYNAGTHLWFAQGIYFNDTICNLSLRGVALSSATNAKCEVLVTYIKTS